MAIVALSIRQHSGERTEASLLLDTGAQPTRGTRTPLSKRCCHRSCKIFSKIHILSHITNTHRCSQLTTNHHTKKKYDKGAMMQRVVLPACRGTRRHVVVSSSRCTGRFRRTLSSSSRHATLTADHVQAFCQILPQPATQVVQDAAILADRNTDWTKHYTGKAQVVLFPSTPTELAAVLQYCNAQRLAVVPQGGRTGLVGGGIGTGPDTVLVALDQMNQIVHLDETTGILQCQAGCILQLVQEHAAAHGYLVPIDLGSKGSCQIGGNLSTNAGGQYYYRYGSLAANVVGLQVVLADGRLLDLHYSAPNLKDNTGYKLYQLFLGAEGTLGIITAVALQCAPLPISVQAVLLACDSYHQVLQVLRTARRQLGEIVGALEFMDATVLQQLRQAQHKIPLLRADNDDVFPYYLLVETHGSNEAHDTEKMQQFVETLLEEGVVENGVMAADESQRQSFWALREAANPTFGSLGYGYKYDVSVPVGQWDDFCNVVRKHLQQHLPPDVTWIQGNWGHIMDGNLHWNLVTPGRSTLDPRVLEQIEPFLLQQVLERKGSISAEHGLGQAKNKYLPMVHSEVTLQTMQELKALWDPNGIMNPGKVLPPKE